MKLLIDIGNTNTTLAVTKNGRIAKRYFIHTAKKSIETAVLKRLLGAKIEKIEKNKCTYCGAELTPGSAFCNSCGKKIEKTEEKEDKNICVKCGVKLEPESAFCNNCGEKLGKG